jgi:hypothetical protein|tara:strand:- start:561 stop:1076 length:516 start_codon:yes stop_codon:yes gene_type:complete
MEALPFPQKTSPTPPQLKAATHKKSHWHHFKEAFKILAVVGFMILMYTSGKVVQKVVMTMRDFFASVSLFQLICLIIPIQIVRRGTLPIYIFLGPLSSFFILCIAVNHGYYNGTLIYQFLKLLEPFVIFPLIRYGTPTSQKAFSTLKRISGGCPTPFGELFSFTIVHGWTR